ncbi:hypothetical protein [Longimicrobium sp.]|jgi:hypothetical protein|uniref:hypothetical protein n=1 Tax=Longimicrobium sp. TaxID=2029185 RepID=UPI002ED9E36F
MYFPNGRLSRVFPALVLAALTAACTDGPLAPSIKPAPTQLAALQCVVHVASAAMACKTLDPPGAGALTNRIVGGQDTYVKLTNTNTSYSAGTGIFKTDVQVQNLTQQTMGTDGFTISGVQVFFSQGPSTTTGTVTVAKADGTDTFLNGAAAPYFDYPQTLAPMEISAAREWQFQVAGGATTFTFRVYVNTETASSGPLQGPTWDGSESSAWFTAANWLDGVVPDGTSAATVPPADQIPGATMPVLTANASVLHLRVGNASTLGLGGFTMTVGGNLDAIGSISNGTVSLMGTGSLLRGNIPAAKVTGSTFLQGAVKASGPVSVTGSLTVADSALSIAVP